MLKELTAILSDYFEVGCNCYHYILERVKHAELSPEDFREYNEDVVAEIAEHLIANGVTAQRWVPVTERLPEKEGSYLVCSKTGKVYTSHYYTKRKISEWYTRKAEWSHPNVTHWMPLPEPPKGE